MGGNDDDLVRRLHELLDGALVQSRAANDAQIKQLADARVKVLVAAASGIAGTKVRTTFGWFLISAALFTFAFAIYMRVDGRQQDSLVWMFLSLLPLIGGGWYLRCAIESRERWAAELNRLEAPPDITPD
jgi:hypothetical protein